MGTRAFPITEGTGEAKVWKTEFEGRESLTSCQEAMTPGDKSKLVERPVNKHLSDGVPGPWLANRSSDRGEERATK